MGELIIFFSLGVIAAWHVTWACFMPVSLISISSLRNSIEPNLWGTWPNAIHGDEENFLDILGIALELSTIHNRTKVMLNSHTVGHLDKPPTIPNGAMICPTTSHLKPSRLQDPLKNGGSFNISQPLLNTFDSICFQNPRNFRSALNIGLIYGRYGRYLNHVKP